MIVHVFVISGCLNTAVDVKHAARTLMDRRLFWAKMFPRETGEVRGEAVRDALVLVHRWVSTCDSSRELSHDPFVCVVNVKSLFFDFITTSLFILC